MGGRLLANINGAWGTCTEVTVPDDQATVVIAPDDPPPRVVVEPQPDSSLRTCVDVMAEKKGRLFREAGSTCEVDEDGGGPGRGV